MESNKSTKAMNIFLEGQPATVTHQSGTKICNHRTYKTSALKKWELTLHYGLLPFKPKAPLEGPICLQVQFGFKANRRKDINTYKLTRPDTDNMIKTLKDAMTKLDFWHDDAQVCHEICSKIYTDKPGIKIQILPMDATKGE